MSLSVRHLLHTLLQHAPRITRGPRTGAGAGSQQGICLTQVTQLKSVKTHPAFSALASRLDVLSAAYPESIQISNDKLVILAPPCVKGQTRPLSATQQTRRGLALDIVLFLGTQPSKRQTFGVIHARFKAELKELGIKDASSLVPDLGEWVTVEQTKKKKTPMLALRKGVGSKAPIDLSSVVRWWTGGSEPATATATAAVLASDTEPAGTSFFTSNDTTIAAPDYLIVRAIPLAPTPHKASSCEQVASSDSKSPHSKPQPPNDILSLLGPLALLESPSPPPPPDLVLPNRSLVWKITTPELAHAASRSLLHHLRPIAIDVDGTVDTIQIAHQPLTSLDHQANAHPAWSIVYVFDVRGLSNPLDLVSPLAHVLHNESVSKVWHAGTNDLKRLHQIGLSVHGPVSDTQRTFSEWVHQAQSVQAAEQLSAGAQLPDRFFAHSLAAHAHALHPPQHVLDALALALPNIKVQKVTVALNTMLHAAGVHLNRHKPKPAGWGLEGKSLLEHVPGGLASGAEAGWLESKAGDVDQLVQAERAMRWRIERLKRMFE